MSDNKITDDIKQFVFEHIDSADQLEILLFLRNNPDKEWSPSALSQELRTSDTAVKQRLKNLLTLNCIEVTATEPFLYRYRAKTPAMDEFLGRVADAYKSYKHSMYEIIFSPMKRARTFAAAFIVKKEGDDHG